MSRFSEKISFGVGVGAALSDFYVPMFVLFLLNRVTKSIHVKLHDILDTFNVRQASELSGCYLDIELVRKHYI